MKSLHIGKIDGLLGGSLAAEIHKLEQERASWMKGITHSQNLAAQMKKLVGETSLAAEMAKQATGMQAYAFAEQMTKQWRESKMAERESIRKMLDPLQEIRKGFLADSATKRMLDDLTKPFAASQQMAALLEQTTSYGAYIKAMQSSIGGSMESARKLLADTSISSSIGQLMKSFEEANTRWVVPQALLNSLGPLQALQEQMGRLSLPVIDAASAATLASMLGPDGIQAQLAALGINPDGSINLQFVPQEEGIGLSRKNLELMALLSFIFAILIPIYQEISSSQWQAATDKTLAAQTQAFSAQSDALEGQRKMIEALSKLVEKAVEQEAKRQGERLVVLDRVAAVRSKPEHGSAILGKLLPREVARPISKSGKWIEIEYYHWLHKEHRTGWVLKKYFQRVPANFERSG